ncbi:hypothetical protein Anapl_02864 [Anas platyrhynchos]|uniref:Uncharacterized protein n=1 Tax=Anas platyrhynchos TaxID=8839 RepID=R0LN16_ANAPL|nr:hypothetical protein Anapl_02864 [Anas platyrhynchos]
MITPTTSSAAIQNAEYEQGPETAQSWRLCPRALIGEEELPTLPRTIKIAPTHTHQPLTPDSHSDGTKPQHTPGYLPLEKCALKKSSKHSIGQPETHNDGTRPQHSPPLLATTTQLEGRAANALQDRYDCPNPHPSMISRQAEDGHARDRKAVMLH